MINFKLKMKVLKENLNKYLKASKKEKGKILDSLSFSLNMKRDRLVRNFRKLQLRDNNNFKETRGRKRIYTNSVDGLLKEIWNSFDRLSGELLYPMLNEYLKSFKNKKGYKYSKEDEELLLKMSLGTVKNRIGYFRKKEGTKKKSMSGTNPSELKRIIPVFHGDWSKKGIGFGQLDTVCFCGWSLLGDFVWALDYVDMATYWTIFRFQWNKSQRATIKSFDEIRERLPWSMLGAHPDSGSEFINWLLKEHCDKLGIELTRSRPGKKNDNHGVEERNGHVIRKFFGYHRFDNLELLDELNILADKVTLYINHFKPVRRTIKKEKYNSKYVRKFDKAKTPFQRVLEEKSISQEIKDKLIKEHLSLDPLTLKREIDTIILTLLDKNRKLTKSKSKR